MTSASLASISARSGASGVLVSKSCMRHEPPRVVPASFLTTVSFVASMKKPLVAAAVMTACPHRRGSRRGRAQLGTRGDGDDPPRRADVHRRRPVHGEFRLRRRGDSVYIGQAAHCSGTGGNTATDGCTRAHCRSAPRSRSPAPPSPARWPTTRGSTMQANGETNADACAYNDLALVRIDPADAGKVNPRCPFWGGPTGLATSTALATGSHLGNSGLRRRHHAAVARSRAVILGTPATAGATTSTR